MQNLKILIEKQNLSILFVLLGVILIYVNYLAEFNDFIINKLLFYLVMVFIFSFNWIGLPFSYLIKKFFIDKKGKLLSKIFTSVFNKKTVTQTRALLFISRGFFRTQESVLYLLIFPLAIEGIIIFQIIGKIFPELLSIFLNKHIFFLTQISGAAYVYFLLTDKFHKYFNLDEKSYYQPNQTEIKIGLKSLFPIDYYVGGLMLIMGAAFLKIFLFKDNPLGWGLFVFFLIWGIFLMLYPKIKKFKN